MVRRRILRTAIIVGIIAALAILALSFRDINFLGLNRSADGPLGLTLGLDLQGGSYLKYQARFSDEVNVTFSRLPDEGTVQTLEVEGALTGQPVIVEAEEDEGNVFGIQAPDATGLTSADLEEDVRGELKTLADEKGLIVAVEPTVEATDEGVGFTATFRPKEGFGEDQILAAMRGIDSRASIRDSEFQGSNIVYAIEFPQVTIDEELQDSITEVLTSLAPVLELTVRPGRVPSDDDMAGVIDTINRRINALGTSEPTVQILGDDKVIVQIPGVDDLEEAKETIGTTAQLVFEERICESEACLEYNDVPIGDGLSGDDLEDAYPDRDTAGLPAVSLRFDGRGTGLFADLTRRIQGDSTRRIVFTLDNEEILAPVARAYIPDGRTIITGGSFTLQDTRTIAIQLKAGAIPVPLTPIAETTVDATLGQDSLDRSLKAGLVGLALVLVFMVVYYRAPGIVAAVALMVYAAILLAVFKLLPVTLTLSGLAGVILSIGMAVDANVLIFERVKEELRTGRTLASSMEVGFRRAWTAIFDGNVSTLITCAILWWLGSRLGAPQVTGFSITLGIGVAVSMFTAVTVSRNMLQLMALTRWGRNTSLFTPEGRMRAASASGGGGED
jgi:preprotein translocase subunit SecD